MIRYRALLLGVLAFVFSTGCMLSRAVSITGSGNVTSREFRFSEFERVEVSQAFKARIRQGESYGVVVRVDEALEEYLEVTQEGDTLQIGLQPGRTYNVRRATMEVEVTMPVLAGLSLSGSSQATVSGFQSSTDLEVGLSGASLLSGDVQVGQARFSLSGASKMDLRGSAGDLDIHASGASEADLAAFVVNDAEVAVSGDSSVTVNPEGKLNVHASGSSEVYYLGTPVLGTLSASGDSSIEHK